MAACVCSGVRQYLLLSRPVAYCLVFLNMNVINVHGEKVKITDKIISAKYSWVRSVDVPVPVAAQSMA